MSNSAPSGASSTDRRAAERCFLDRFVFYDLVDINDGFDAPTIRYFSADDFAVALDRIEVFGIGVHGIEPWRNGNFYDVKIPRDYGADPFDPNWYKQAFQEFLEDGVELQFAASYEVPDDLLRTFLR